MAPFIDKILDFKAAEHHAPACFAQTGGGTLRLFAIEARMGRNEFRDGSPVARYDYFGPTFDLIEQRA
jgi:hypothetical protein